MILNNEPGIPPQTAPTRWRDPVFILLVALGFTALVSLLVYTGRGFALFGDLRLFSTTGEEGVVINGVWKAANGFPIYQMPDRDPFELSLYNYLFFWSYGGLAAWLGLDGDALVTFCRLLTLASAALGAFAQWRILVMALGSVTRRESAVIILLSLLTWYGTFYMNWWLVSVRPDVPAVALAMAGLWWFLASLRTGARWWPIIPAILAFYAAWAFKQSVVWTLTGAVAGALIVVTCRRQALLLAIPVAVAFAVTLALGTEAYRYQIVTAPTLNRIIFLDSIDRFFALIPPLALFWVFAAIPLAARGAPKLFRTPFVSPLDEHGTIVRRILIVICAVTVPLGFIAVGKEGSGRNHLMEAVVALSTLAAIHLIQIMRTADSPTRSKALWLAAVLGISLCLRPLHSALGAEWQGLRVGNNADVVWHRQLATFMRELPKPVYMTDEIQAQAWNSTTGDRPGQIVDAVYYFAAKRSDKLIGGGLPSMFSQRQFAAILIPDGDVFYDEVVPPALASGYVDVPNVPEFLRKYGYKLLLRDDSVKNAGH